MKYNSFYFNDINFVFSNLPYLREIKNCSILITGVTGLIGSTIADLFLYSNKTFNSNIKLYFAGRNKDRIENRFSIYQNFFDYEYIRYDSTKDLNFPKEIDYIIHCASYGDPLSFKNHPVEIMTSNFIGMKNILDQSIKCKTKKNIFISSSEVYGINDKKEIFFEDDYGYMDILLPRSCYPSSKRATETLCAAYSNEYNINTSIVRPAHIYGPQFTDDDSKISSDFIRKALNHETLILKSDGSQKRNYTNSLDCASGILTVLIRGNNNSAYNISNYHEQNTIRHFAELISNKTNVELKFELASTSERINFNKMQNSTINSSKLEKLGWQCLFDLEKGLTSCLNILRG